ncbi:MAG: dihydroorotase family protein, partial [Nitrososphaerales archaeon]
FGVDITCEATPHHAILGAEMIDLQESRYIVEPPIRSKVDSAAIRRGISRGSIPILATDHAPHSLDEKTGVHPPPGFPGFETALAVFMRMVYAGDLKLERLVTSLTEAPSKRFGLDNCGRIQEGFEGNITVFDPRKGWTVRSDVFLSKAKYSPFEGHRLKGKVYATFIRGKLSYLDGAILSAPLGKVIKRNKKGARNW